MKNLVTATEKFVKNELSGAEGGHDWWHIYRVWQLAKRVASTEKVDITIVELGALLHDIADSKFHGGNEEVGPKKAHEFLCSIGASEDLADHVANIVRFVSYKGGHQQTVFSSPELDVVQDADRLDALGAIGIARTFNYGGFKERAIYDPDIPPNLNMSKEEYKNSTAPSINHFYEKLLLLKDRMNTSTGRDLAEERHAFLELYLNQFYEEWDGKR